MGKPLPSSDTKYLQFGMFPQFNGTLPPAFVTIQPSLEGDEMEPHLRTTPDGVEAEPRKVGHRWLDLILAGSAILISVVSVSVAVHHGHVQEELVAANSWPFLRYEHGNFSDDDEAIVNMAIRNVGVGPALLKTLRVSYDGKPVLTRMDLLTRCCGFSQLSPAERQHANLLSNQLHSAVVPADEEKVFLALRRENHPVLWEKLNQERWKLKMEACYCSVLHTCWRSDLTGLEPERVEQCEHDPALDFRE